MSPIRAILIDFGGVIYRQPDPARTANWLKRFGIRNLDALTVLNTSPLESPLVMAIMTGQIQEQQVWDNIAKEWRVRPGILNFIREQGYSKRRLNHDLIQYILSIRPQFQTAILTNAGTDFRRTFCRIFGLTEIVDQVIISAEEKLAKPDQRFYQLAVERLGISPCEAVFLDDMLVNVEGAKRAGLNAFQHINVQQSILTLQNLLQST